MYLLYAKKHAVVFQSPSRVWLSVTPWTVAHQASLSLTISQSVPKFVLIVSVMLSSHLILWCPLLLLPSIFPSNRDFSNELAVFIRWQNTGASVSASILPMSIQGWCPLRLTGLISLLYQYISLNGKDSLKKNEIAHSSQINKNSLYY